jgi:segregation and condensation protein A
MWSLINAFRTIWIRNDYASITEIKLELELLTLDQKVAELVTKFKICKDFLFEELFDENPTRFEIVITFLAVLELIRSRVLIAIQDLPYSSIKIVYIEENGINAIS